MYKKIIFNQIKSSQDNSIFDLVGHILTMNSRSPIIIHNQSSLIDLCDEFTLIRFNKKGYKEVRFRYGNSYQPQSNDLQLITQSFIENNVLHKDEMLFIGYEEKESAIVIQHNNQEVYRFANRVIRLRMMNQMSFRNKWFIKNCQSLDPNHFYDQVNDILFNRILDYEQGIIEEL